MLHSLQYYACCYALLCLLHQQQRAASLTIIIDGATTNEWATRDEYRRMLEASNDLETALSQQQQQQQQDQLEYQQQQEQPPPYPPLPVRQLTERGSAPQRFCGHHLMDALELVCQGRFYNQELEPQIAEPISKTKRASKLRTLSSSFQSPPPLPSPASQLSASSLKQLPLHLPSQQQQQQQQQQPPPTIQADGEESYPAEGAIFGPESGNGANRKSGERSSLQQLQMQLEAQLPHLAINMNRQTGTDNNNDGDTIITETVNNNNNNINPLTNKPRNRYNRMVLNRRVRGATEECCKNSCELDNLKAYCKL